MKIAPNGVGFFGRFGYYFASKDLCNRCASIFSFRRGQAAQECAMTLSRRLFAPEQEKIDADMRKI